MQQRFRLFINILTAKSWILGLSNEVYNFSVAQVALEITGVKVERSKKDPVLLSKSSFFFDRSTLTPVISRTNYVSELLYTSLESPNIQLFGTGKIWGMANPKKSLRHF